MGEEERKTGSEGERVKEEEAAQVQCWVSQPSCRVVEITWFSIFLTLGKATVNTHTHTHLVSLSAPAVSQLARWYSGRNYFPCDKLFYICRGLVSYNIEYCSHHLTALGCVKQTELLILENESVTFKKK